MFVDEHIILVHDDLQEQIIMKIRLTIFICGNVGCEVRLHNVVNVMIDIR